MAVEILVKTKDGRSALGKGHSSITVSSTVRMRPCLAARLLLLRVELSGISGSRYCVDRM